MAAPAVVRARADTIAHIRQVAALAVVRARVDNVLHIRYMATLRLALTLTLDLIPKP